MIRPLVTVLGVLLAAGMARADAKFVYDEHGKKDPFTVLVSATGEVITEDADMTVTDMNLEGIMVDAKGNNLAIINGKVVKALDVVGGFRVEAINADAVELAKNKEHFTVKLKKGDK